MTTFVDERRLAADARLHLVIGAWLIWYTLRYWLRLEPRPTTGRHARDRCAPTWFELARHYVTAIFVFTTVVVTPEGERIETSSALNFATRFTLRVVAFASMVALLWWFSR